MKFYEVAPASRQYQGSSLLTYSSEETLAIGQIVEVAIRGKTAFAFVVQKVSKPDFKTAEIDQALDQSLPLEHVSLFSWLTTYYPSPLGLTASLFLPFNKAAHYDPKDDSYKQPKTELPPPLTKEQKEAVATAVSKDARTLLLHGETGSGKTRVYIELTLQALHEGKSVLILVPEISLSPQIVKSFQQYIHAPVRVTHSDMTPAQRRKVRQAVVADNIKNNPQVIIGPRSAMFLPLQNIGLIVMDEFHESAYKQDQAPYYQTVRVAGKLAQLHSARFMLGSATPSISEYYIAQQRTLPIVRMKEKAVSSDVPGQLRTTVVNLKDSAERSKYPLISATLLAEITASLGRKEQTLLFLNKRGHARLLLCQQCGWHAVCPRCDLPLTFHGDTHRLQCHTCGFNQPAPSICPSCSSHDIIFKSPGTKAVAEAIQNAFPDAIVGRFDKDNLKAERLESRHGDIVSGKIDILVGTQLLAKGHDLPRLSIVGILMAENELQFPDYTSSERSYQLMHQLIGRVGRGHRAGTVIVQTYDPENLAVRTAIREQSWEDFYAAQIQERRHFGFPPFYHLMKIEISRARLPTVHSACRQVLQYLHDSGERIEIIGPSPSFIEKRNNTFNWQIIVKAKDRSALTRLAVSMPGKTIVNLDPSNLL